MFYINISTYELAEGHGRCTQRTGSKLCTRGLKKINKIYGGWRWGVCGGVLLPFLFTWCVRVWEWAQRRASWRGGTGIVCQGPGLRAPWKRRASTFLPSFTVTFPP